MNPNPQRALIVIDIQNDYFPDGKFPLWQPEPVLARIEQAIAQARRQGVAVIFVQHVADASKGPAPFFNPGTPGVALHARLLQAAPDAPIVIKRFADSFLGTDLEAQLAARGIEELLVCGMMTQNCVTHTAISKSAEKYRVSVLSDCCTTVSQMIHLIALNGVAPRVTVCDAASVGL
ncbi:cysteine hydrolase family protein [Dechloromonas sp. ZS-1]|uniref:cysteine hydrolase family protein n=1 Tax=Dechloromonas sp. ZS-1 TaxID=3138067 RepID=UPI0031FC3993